MYQRMLATCGRATGVAAARRMMPKATRRAAGLTAIALVLSTGACTSHGAPKMRVRKWLDGTRVSYAGVAITVPTGWGVRNTPPSACLSIAGDTAYFFVNDTDPTAPGLGCPSGGPTGPYLTVECHPQVPPPPGPALRVGPFAAFAVTHRLPSGGREYRTVFLRGRDTMVEIYGSPRQVNRIEASLSQVAGSC